MPPMTGQKAKMLAGELYFAYDEELNPARDRAEALMQRFNTLPAGARVEARAVLSELFGAIGPGTYVRPTLRCDYGFNIFIGARSFLNFDCILLDCNRIDIGDDVQIAPGVHIYTATHPLDATLRKSGAEQALPVKIGDGVWLGGGCIVCPGVTIGENTVVAAGSVVTRDMPAGVLAAGSPCRVIREL